MPGRVCIVHSQVHCDLYTAVCATNHPFQPKPPITKVLVPSLYRESIARSSLKSIQPFLYKVLPVNKIILKRASFSSPLPPSPPSPPPFQTFVGLREPRGQILYLNIRLFVS